MNARGWKSIIGFSAALAFLGGCAVGPNYQRADLSQPIPQTFAGAATTNVVETPTNQWKVATPRAELPKGEWWKIFGEPELNQLESDATVANQQLKAAVARF